MDLEKADVLCVYILEAACQYLHKAVNIIRCSNSGYFVRPICCTHLFSHSD
jgi:hypothetical protein